MKRAVFLFVISISFLSSLSGATGSDSCRAYFKFSVNPDIKTLVPSTAINFYDVSDGKVKEWYWDFGENNTSREQHPMFIFNHPTGGPNVRINPYRTVTLTIITEENCKSQFSQIINIMEGTLYDSTICHAAFGYDKKDMLMSPVPSLTLSFYYKSDPEATEWLWDFGDGTTSSESNPVHTWFFPSVTDSVSSAKGVYRTICLTVKTINDCKVTVCETLEIFPPEPDPVKNTCQAAFKYFPLEDAVSVPEVIQYQLMDVSEGEVLSRLWTFDNGKTSEEKELVMPFSIFQKEHKVCLTVTFADSCVSTVCQPVYITGTTPEPEDCRYVMKVKAAFPADKDSCSAYASARVFDGENVTEAKYFSWSTGDTLPDVKGLCANVWYSVKAMTPDGCVAYTSFVIDQNGVITEKSPVNWWITGDRSNFMVTSDAAPGMIVEWRLCDGTVVQSDSIPLNAINCGSNQSNLILKDASGNVLYTENISLRTLATQTERSIIKPEISLWPNPVKNRLMVKYPGDHAETVQIEISDLSGKKVITEQFTGVNAGSELTISTGTLHQGFYICRIIADGNILAVKKITKR